MCKKKKKTWKQNNPKTYLTHSEEWFLKSISHDRTGAENQLLVVGLINFLEH